MENASGTSPQSDTTIPAYPVAPFVTPPQASPSPSASPQKDSLSTDTTATAPLATSSTSELPNPSATQVGAAPRPNTIQANPTPSPRASSSSPPSLQTDEHSDTSVTVDAVPAQSHGSKRPNITENVHPPSRGALVAFGVLTVFFVVMTLSLLLWRKRRNSKAAKKDALAEMEEAQNSTREFEQAQNSPRQSSEVPSEKASSPKRNSRNSAELVSETPEKEEEREVTSKPLGGRSILRPVRPPSLQIDPRLNNHELSQKNERELRRMKFERPNSWRSSIASAWATLGLPSKVLQDTTTQQPWDGASVHSQRSVKHLLHSSFSITEEPSSSEKPDTPTTLSDNRSSNSPTLSTSSFGDTKELPNSSRLSHESSLTSQQEGKQTPQDLKSNQDRNSLPVSVSQPGTLDSHATTSDVGIQSHSQPQSPSSSPPPPPQSSSKTNLQTITPQVDHHVPPT